MWERILELLQDGMVMLCTALAFLIPFGIAFMNKKFHKIADPPWKRDTRE